MSENFTNFIKKSNASTTTEEVIIPNGLEGSNTIKYDSNSTVTQSRSIGSTIQAHSIYISFANTSHQTSDSTYYASLYIKDTRIANKKFYIVNDFAIKTHQSFFVEKNLTLTPTQSLCIEYLTTSSKNIDIICSCVEI